MINTQFPIKFGHRLAMALLGLGVIGFGAAVWASGCSTEVFFRSYWIAFIFYTAISLGALYFVLFQHLTRSSWSVVVRRVAELLMQNIGVMGLFLLPIIFGVDALFSWADPAHMANDAVLQAKAPYLNVPFFWIRSIGYFAIWVAISKYFFSLSRRQDVTGDPEITAKLQARAGIALAVYGLTQTFAAFDWLMSLDPHWFSTLFGVYFFAGTSVVSLGVLSAVLLLLRMKGLLSNVVTVEHYHDLGKLLYGYMLFWAYCAFAQFMVVYAANIPEEVNWYLIRGHFDNPWQTVTLVLAVGYFVLPLFGFMSRHAKRNLLVHFGVAIWLVGMQLLDYVWIIRPNFSPNSLGVSLVDAAVMLGFTGVYFGILVWQFTRHPLIPVKDPRLQESLKFENF